MLHLHIANPSLVDDDTVLKYRIY